MLRGEGGSIYVVSLGKTWKIESAIYSDQIVTVYALSQIGVVESDQEDYIMINGASFLIRKSSANTDGDIGNTGFSAASLIWEQKFPIWLPAGTTIQASTNVAYLSAIEFISQ